MNLGRATTTIALLFALLAAGCDRGKSSAAGGGATPAQPKASIVPPEGARMTIVQRQVGRFPASNAKLLVYIGDITNNQTLVKVSDRNGTMLLDQVSMKAGDQRPFEYDDAKYIVAVEKLNNLIIGDDFADVRIFAPAAGRASDAERIQAAIAKVESSGHTFIRNGEEHAAKEAADHLRRKLEGAGEQVKTFDEFVEHVATRSKISGEEYHVKLKDGSSKPLREWIRQE
jgi:hypothetical protein